MCRLAAHCASILSLRFGENRRTLKTVIPVVLAGLTLAVLLAQQTAPVKSSGPQFTSDQQLLLPANYREWVFLSSGLGMTYGPAAEANRERTPMFDNVFVNPAAYQAFLTSGKWPPQTMFILEVRGAVSKGSINNGGHYQGDVIAVEAEVKDTLRFPGAGWAFFGFGKSNSAKMIPATAVCYTCHAQKAAVDNTFVQFYPTLLPVAKEKGTLNPAYVSASAVEGH
jgi:Cytochrome P460